MRDLHDVLAAWAAAREHVRRGVLATVVKVAGSTYRRPGARMFFTEGRSPVGLLSGGCLEADLAQRAEEVLAAGRPSTVLYDMRSPDDVVFGLGLGCDGAVRVLLEPLEADAEHPSLRFLEQRLRARAPGVLLTVFDGGPEAPARPGARALVRDDGAIESSDLALEGAAQRDVRRALEQRRSRVSRVGRGAAWFEALVEYVPLQLRLWIFGAGTDARPLARQAAALGWRVEVFDHRAASLDREHFPQAALRRLEFDAAGLANLQSDVRTAAVVMTHHFLHDVELIRALLAGTTPYVGLIGPRKRCETLLVELGQADPAPHRGWPDRLHGPVGLDIGAETPEEIALAIVAEIQAVFSGRDGGPLRDRRGPLHDPAA